MKIRNDFVTNSSSSSFILRNNTDRDLNGKEFVMELMQQILIDAENENIVIPANGQIELECGDHIYDDGSFEYFIHNIVGSSWAPDACFTYRFDSSNDNIEHECPVTVQFKESHH